MESNQNLQQPPASLQQDTLAIQTHGLTFRVSTLRYIRKKVFLNLVTIFWWQAIVALVFFMLIDVAGNNYQNSNYAYMPLLIQMCIFAVFLTVIVFCNYKYLNQAFTYSTLLTTLYLIALTILYGLHIDALWIASIIYVTLIMMLSLTYFKAIKNIVLIGILCIQLNLIACKFDVRFDASWPAVLFILIVVCIVTGIVGIVLIGFGFIQRQCEPRFALQPIGIMYMGLVHTSFSLDAAVIITKLLFNIEIYPIAIPCALMHVLLIIFALKYKNQISLFKAKAVQSVGPHLRHEVAKITKVFQSKKLYRLSANWFSFKERPVSSQKYLMDTQLVIQTCHTLESSTQCVVCLSKPAMLVWMPCGHMTICQACGDYLMKSGKVNCVLCKKRGEQIYHLCQKVSNYYEKQYLADFYYKIQANF